jgi:hypothetical protein
MTTWQPGDEVEWRQQPYSDANLAYERGVVVDWSEVDDNPPWPDWVPVRLADGKITVVKRYVPRFALPEGTHEKLWDALHELCNVDRVALPHAPRWHEHQANDVVEVLVRAGALKSILETR